MVDQAVRRNACASSPLAVTTGRPAGVRGTRKARLAVPASPGSVPLRLTRAGRGQRRSSASAPAQADEYGAGPAGATVRSQKETPLAVPLARLLTTPDMWRTFAESYLEALEAAGRADPRRPRTIYGTFDETSYRRKERADDLAAWHEMLLDRFAGSPEDELLDRLAASPALAGPNFSSCARRLRSTAVTSPRPPRSSRNA